MRIFKVALLVSSLSVLILGPGASHPAGQPAPTVSSDLASTRGTAITAIASSCNRRTRAWRRFVAASMDCCARIWRAAGPSRWKSRCGTRGAEAQSALRAHLGRPAGRRRHGDHQQGDRGDDGVAGNAGAARPARARPATRARSVGVAVLDSGIATHTALDTRVVARVNLVSDEPGVTGDPFGHGTHIAGHHRRQPHRGEVRDGGVRGRQRAGGAPDRRARARLAPAPAAPATSSPASTGSSTTATPTRSRSSTFRSVIP